jgi:stearoyl-CoA desaturase (delta-9 desaturase)
MTIKQQQTLKFFILCFLAVLGLTVYILDGGSFLKAAILYLVFGIISKTANIAYHRWLAHNYFEPNTFGKFILLYAVVCSALVRPLHYIIGHRAHHRYSDSDKDPHPPSLGFWNLLVGNFNTPPGVPIKDVLRRKEVMFVDRHYWKLYVLNLIVFWIIDKDIVLLSFALMNLKFLLVVTIFNYASHGGSKQLGPQNLPSWTNWVLGYFGEHLHKNHHISPSDSNFGKISKYNFDVIHFLLTKITNVK